MFSVTQTRTDTAHLEPFGPVTLVTFVWGDTGSTKDTSTWELLSTAQVQLRLHNRRRKTPLVDDLSGLVSHRMLTPEGLKVVDLYGLREWNLKEFIEEWPTGITGVTPPMYESAAEVRHALAGLDEKAIRRSVVELVEGVVFFELDADQDARPRNDPVRLEVVNSYVDIDRARAHLATHPLVKAMKYNRGRPGSYDHVASSLTLVVQVPEQERAILASFANDRAARTSFDHPRYVGSHILTESWVWAVASAVKRGEPPKDPLGLAPFVRHEELRPPRDDSGDY